MPKVKWLEKAILELPSARIHGFPDSSVGKEHLQWYDSRVRKIPWRRERLRTPVFLGFPCDSASKDSACNVGNLGLIPDWERPPGKGKDYPLQHPGLENSMDCTVHVVAKSDTTERLLLTHTSAHRAHTSHPKAASPVLEGSEVTGLWRLTRAVVWALRPGQVV